MDEDILIEKAKAGDRESMELLIQRNYSIVKGYLIKLSFDEVLSDDLTQETFYRVLLNLKKYTKRAKFSSYLIAIATNLYRDYYRKNRRIVGIDDQRTSIDELLIGEEKGIENTTLDRIEYKKTIELLKSLPPEKRTVFVLKHFYGLSYKEIAEIEKCSLGTAKSRLYYCIKTLRELLRGSDEIEY